MNESKDKYAVSTLMSWYQDHIDVFNNHMAISKFNDSGNGYANVQLDTDQYLMNLRATDQSSHLEIGALEVASDESTLQYVGECESKTVFEGHLHSFMEWFKDEHKQNTSK